MCFMDPIIGLNYKGESFLKGYTADRIKNPGKKRGKLSKREHSDLIKKYEVRYINPYILFSKEYNDWEDGRKEAIEDSDCLF